ncbi:MAG: metallophosphoesterase [Bacteroidales bacterium]|nr:metallophosphoesterase [Bacteroidales bacterium]
MKIQYCSDLHLEFTQNNDFLKRNPLIPKGDILLLAGDIIPLHDKYLKHSFFDYISDNFEQIYWVAGNHEFFQRDMMEFEDTMNIKIRKNVKLVNNLSLEYKGIKFLFSCLWSKISRKNEEIIIKTVTDFENIYYNKKVLKPEDFNRFHKTCFDFLEHSLDGNSEKVVIVTHHLPSDECCFEGYRKTAINEAFCIDLTDFINKCNADFWIYGHSHYNQKPLKTGNTSLLTNQLGYVHMNEQKGYVCDAVFEI